MFNSIRKTMKSLFLSTLLLPLSILATADNAEGSNLSETVNSKSDSNNSANCTDIKSKLRSGFYPIDNLDGDMLDKAALNTNQEFLTIKGVDTINVGPDRNSGYGVYFEIKRKARSKMMDITQYNVGNYMILIVNDEVLHSAYIQIPLSGSFVITGFDSIEEAELIRSKIECAMRYS